MNKSNRLIILLIASLIVGCFASVILLTQPSFSEIFNLSSASKSNIGTVIGGITAPLIGIFSSVLLYLALTRQTDSNKEQQLKNESDIIFLLINQLENELNSFYTKETTERPNNGKVEKIERKLTGIEGLNDFCRQYRYEFNFEYLDEMTFKSWYESNQIMLFVDTFNLIQKRISISNLSTDLKSLFKEKLSSFYKCRLKTPLSSLSSAFELNPMQKDDYTLRIQKFVEKNN